MSGEEPSRRALTPRVVVFAYACEPGAGSEPEAGWAVVSALAEMASCVVLVGAHHLPALERSQAAGATRATFVPVGPSHRAPRGPAPRLTWFIRYLVWLRQATTVARRLHAEDPFNAACHVSYAAYWLPTAATRLDIPCLWGPVGGGVTTPRPLRGLLGWRGRIVEVYENVAVRAAARLPATRRSWRGVTVGLIQNEATLRRLPAWLQARCRVLNHAAFVQAPTGAAAPTDALVHVTSLEARKGTALALHAMALTPPDVHLIVVGDGPQRRRLERLAARLGVADRVVFTGRLPRARVLQLLGRAAGAVYCGLREEGGVALAEALAAGVPVAVLAHGGARTVAETTTDPRRVLFVAPGAVEDTAPRLADALSALARAPRSARMPLLDGARARRELRAALDATVRSV